MLTSIAFGTDSQPTVLHFMLRVGRLTRESQVDAGSLLSVAAMFTGISRWVLASNDGPAMLLQGGMHLAHPLHAHS